MENKYLLMINRIFLITAATLLMFESLSAQNIWQSPRTPIANPNVKITAIRFFGDGKNGVIGGSNGYLAYTADSGDTWYESEFDPGVKADVAPFDISAIKISDVITDMTKKTLACNNSCLIAVAGSSVLVSNDKGRKWGLVRNLKSDAPSGSKLFLNGADFDDENNGWFLYSAGRQVAGTYKFQKSYVAPYVHENELWASPIGINSQKEFYNIFLSGSDGWIVGEGGSIMYSHDGGKEWTSQQSNVKTSLVDGYFTSRDEGWIVGNENTILKTTDGKTWSRFFVYKLISTDFRAIKFIDQCRGWIVGKSGVILNSDYQNGQIIRWNAENSGTENDLRAVEAVYNEREKKYRVWVGGERSTLLRFEERSKKKCETYGQDNIQRDRIVTLARNK